MTSSAKEQTYFLSKLLNQGGCLSCLNKRCLIKEQHGVPFPDKFCNYIKYPINISDIKNSIEKENIDLEGKTPIYTICNYINKVCKNCEEGRYKRIKLNNKNFVICFSLTKNDKIMFGIHIDLKLVLKGTQFDVISIPYDMKIKKAEISIKEAMNLLLDKEKSFIKPTVQIEILSEENESKKNKDKDNNLRIQIDSLVFSEEIRNTENINVDKNIQLHSENNILIVTSKNTDIAEENGIITNEEDFPVLSPSSKQIKVISPKTVDYSQINKKLKNDIIEKEILEKKKNEYLEKIKVEKESKNKITKIESYLNKKIIELELKIVQLENDIKKNNLKYQTYIKNKDIYDEIFFNKNKINTIVYDTFYSTNYEDYIIL
jgi:hypothetical protein